MTALPIEVNLAREQFPALETGFAFLENAGGSQLPRSVIEAVREFMVTSYVQTTAGYPASDRATEIGVRAHEVCETLMGSNGKGSVILGSSTTQLTHNLASCLAPTINPGDEVVISVANHEANIGAWLRYQESGAIVKWWGVDPETGEMRIEDLQALLTERTKLVTLPHTSNLLGNIVDVAAVAALVHSFGARVIVDGVAYAPHAFMNVADWDVDFYAYSTYKVYGPHMGVLYGKSEALAGLEGHNHFFIDKNDWPYKFELGCLSWEGCAAIVGLCDYFSFLAGRQQFDREAVEGATSLMRAWERPLAERLLQYLASKSSVRVVGPRGDNRVPTVSFVSTAMSSDAIARHVNQRDIGIRNGHMYSHRLTQTLGVAPEPGFVRVSAVHYNTLEEIDRLCEVLDEVL